MYNKGTTQQTIKDKTMKNEIEVIGRNGHIYDAIQISSELCIVGKFIVLVEDGKCEETICRATKANIAKYSS